MTDAAPPARALFRDAYGEIDAATWQRARYRALFYGVVLLDYGLVAGDAGMATAGRDALRLAAD